MVAPINYMAGAADPSQIIAQGYQMGLAGAQARQDAQLREAQANKLRIESERKQKMQADLTALQENANPTAADYSRIVTAYPELADPMKKSWEIMDAGQQKANISLMSQALSAVKSGKPEIAQQLLTDQATALRNSGKENEAKASETWAKLITIHPEMAVNTATMALAAVMDPKEFSPTYDKMNSSDAQASKASADAMTAAVTAQNAPLAQQLDMQKTQAEINRASKDSDNSYYTFGQTANGIVRQNARTGQVELVTDSSGNPILGAVADPSLQGKITEAEKTGALSAERVSETKKALKMNDQVLAYAKTAGELLPKATGSGVGAAVDAAGRLIGVSSEASKASARLQALSGWLVSNVPRMEGPQSNFDVDNYKQMAADVGNNKLPIADRQAALDTLVNLIKSQKDLNSQVLSGGIKSIYDPSYKPQGSSATSGSRFSVKVKQ